MSIFRKFIVAILSITIVSTLTKPFTPLISFAQSSEISCTADSGGSNCTVAWNPQNNRLAIETYDQISIWDIDRNEKIAGFTAELGVSKAIAWSPDGKMLAAGTGPYNVYIWEIEQQRIYRSLDIEKEIEDLHINSIVEGVQSLVWKPDGSQLAILHDGSVSLWDIEANTFKVLRPADQSIEGDSIYASSVSWRPDGAWLAVANRQNSVELYDSLTLQLLDNPMDIVHGYFVDPGAQRSGSTADGYYLVLAVQTSYPPATATLIVRRPDLRELIAIQDTERPYINALEWNPKKDLLAVGYGGWAYNVDSRGVVDIWGIYADDPQVLETINFEHHVNSISWSYDGNHLAIATQDGVIHILEININD